MEMKRALEELGVFTAEQWGLVTTKQARGLGVDSVTLYRLKDAGFLELVRRGVYAATAAPASDAREEQAVWLALRPETPGWERDPLDDNDGVLSHSTAARLHGLGELTNTAVALTAPRRRTSREPDVWFKIAQLDRDDISLLGGLPVTTVTRTVCDLLEQHVDASHVATIIRQAVLADQVRLDVLVERIAPYARRYGARPNDGAGLLDHLLEQIGVQVADLLVRPIPAQLPMQAAHEAMRHIMTSSALRQLDQTQQTTGLSKQIVEEIRESFGLGKLSHLAAGANFAELSALSKTLGQVRQDLLPDRLREQLRFPLPEALLLWSATKPTRVSDREVSSRRARGEQQDRAVADHGDEISTNDD